MSQTAEARRSWFATPPPHVAVEIGGTHVSAVALATHGSVPVVAAHDTEPLAAGVVVPSLNAPNVHDERALADAIRSVLQRLGGWTRRIGLVLPDTVAKVSLVRFERIPEKSQDLDQLIRWQVRKSAPFRIEEAQVSWQPGVSLPGGGGEFLVSVARTDIVRSYERACQTAGVHAGLVDIASFNLINAVIAGDPAAGDWLLVSLAPDYATLAVVRDRDIVFFRNRATAEPGDLPDLVHQTAMYHEDRLGGGGFAGVRLAGASLLGVEEAERLRRALEDRIGAGVEPLDVRPAAELRDRISAGSDLLDRIAAPVGLLLRERSAARPRKVAS